MDINKLSLDEKIGQRFIFGINDYNIDCLIELIKKTYIGGVILYKKNYDSYEDMLKVIKKLKSANKNNKIPLFITIDQEGGFVNRMPNELHNLKSIYDVSMLNNKRIDGYADTISKMLVDSGINMNFGPVGDIYNNSMSKALFKRCFYGNSKQVSRCIKTYVDSCKKNNLISVIKHYPGHGATKIDSHFIIPYVFNYKEIFNKHIIPFNDAIDNKIDAIMVGHIIIRKLTGIWPASLSYKFIDRYLRSNNYDGLIISDEINMLRRNIFYHFNYMNKVLKSANDIILVKIKNEEEGYSIIEKYKKILENDLYVNRLDESVNRIINIKDKYKVNDNIKYNGFDVDNMNKTIDKINNMI